MAHRRIDVDALDADQFLDDEELALQVPGATRDDEDGGSSGQIKANVTNVVLQAPASAEAIQSAVDARTAEVRSLLSRYVPVGFHGFQRRESVATSVEPWPKLWKIRLWAECLHPPRSSFFWSFFYFYLE
jgi:hypothetical protein